MNYCNFSKVFQARTSKDKNVSDLFQSGKSNTYPTKPKIVNDISDKQRHSKLVNIVVYKENNLKKKPFVLTNMFGNIQCKCEFQFQMTLMVHDYDDMVTR